MTANELLQIARTAKPHIKYALNDRASVIGAWSNDHNDYVPVAALDLLGHWRDIPGQLYVNGKPMVQPEQWVIS